MIKMFSAPELEQVVIGTPELDFEGLQRCAHYEDGFTQESEVRVSYRVLLQRDRRFGE